LLSRSVVLDYCFTIGIDCKLSAEAQIDIQPKKRKAQAKKITGFQVHMQTQSNKHFSYMACLCMILPWSWAQFAPGNPAEVLVTSADSQIRVFDGVTMVQKFRGTADTD
jgi:WD repeat-containing protein 44